MCARLIRFGIVGIGNTAVHYATFWLLDRLTPYVAAHLGAMAVATVVSYLLNCRYTFGVRPGWRSFLLFPLSNLANLVVSTVTMVIAVECGRLDPRFATVLGGIVAIPVTFLVCRRCVGGRASLRTEAG